MEGKYEVGFSELAFDKFLKQMDKMYNKMAELQVELNYYKVSNEKLEIDMFNLMKKNDELESKLNEIQNNLNNNYVSIGDVLDD